MFKHVMFFGALLAVVLFFIIGAATARSAEAAPVVAVSVEPQRYALEKIAGDSLECVVFVPAGADPHTYEPKPSQVAVLARADIYLSIGLEFEKAWLARLAGVNSHLRVLPMNAGLEISARHDAGHDAGHGCRAGGHMAQAAAMREHHADAAGHAEEAGRHHHGLDPHVWTAPAGMRVMAANALNALLELDPANAARYRANCTAFLAEIDALDARIQGLFQDVPPERRTFLVFHPAWGHFAEAYGLTQLSIEVDGKEPGPAELAGIITEAREHGVRAVFIQPQMSKRTALSVAGAVGAQVVEADPLAADWEANLLYVAESFRNAMK